MGRALGEHAFQTRNERQSDGSRRFEVGITCRRCNRTDWMAARDAGWGRRLFTEKGWSCGNGPGRHVCPDCLHKRPAKLSPVTQIMAEAGRPPATIHHLPEPERPIVHVHNPQEQQETPMSAIAAAMQAAEDPKSRTIAKGTKNKPFGFSTEGNAAQAARRILMKDGVVHPTREQHYKTHKSRDGTWSYEIVSRKGVGPAPVGKQIKALEGRPVARRVHAVSAAERQLDNMGIAKPMEGVHFEISGNPGDGWVYRLLPAAHPAPEKPQDAPQPSRLTGGGHLSRHDARKDALAVLQAARKTGGAPVEGVDYWVTQDGYNLWGWTCTNPNPEPPNQAQAEIAPEEKKVGAVANITDAPRKPSPADNRRIMDALDEHYDSDRLRYRAAFNDAGMAQKLDLPRAWITKVREEFFGPEANEADMEATRKQIAAIEAGLAKGAEALARAESILSTAAELETVLAQLKAILAEVKR